MPQLKKWTKHSKHGCATCNSLDGTIQTVENWQESGYYPGCPQLECGEHCTCTLDDVQEETAMIKIFEPTTMKLDGQILPLTKHITPSVFAARFVSSGSLRAAGNIPSGYSISPAALQAASAAGMFDAKPVFIDHAGMFDNPSLRNLVAITEASHWNEETQSVDGLLRFYDTPDGEMMASLLSQILDADNPPDIGLSIVFYPSFDDSKKIISAVHYVESVDLVFQPAADGRILQALSALSLSKSLPNPQENTKMPIQELVNETAKETSEIAATTNDLKAWLDAARTATTSALIASSGLPQEAKDKLSAMTFDNPAQVATAIDTEKVYLAKLSENNIISGLGSAPRSPHIQGGMDGFDQFKLALDGLMDGTRPLGQVRPLSGIREFYNLISGDYEMTGVFHQERVQFANVTSSTMASLVADVLNKRVISKFNDYPQWWKPIAREEDFNNLQSVKYITLAGVGALPTVSEGAAYTELAWDDKTETHSFVKKGGYLGLTLEAIDKDDTGRLRAAPQALALGAYLTLNQAMSAIFTDNAGVGPTMSDSKALFHTDHGNLGTTALGYDAWVSTRQAMRDQTEFAASGGSTAALGMLTAPKFLLVPNELESQAINILGAATTGSGSYLDNTFAEGDQHNARMASARNRVIVVDLWTSAKSWAAVCDPAYYPTIGVGYRYGRAPEVFSVADPRQGLMFTNDVMPVKVRFFFAVGALDWRGLYKHNVS